MIAIKIVHVYSVFNIRSLGLFLCLYLYGICACQSMSYQSIVFQAFLLFSSLVIYEEELESSYSSSLFLCPWWSAAATQ